MSMTRLNGGDNLDAYWKHDGLRLVLELDVLRLVLKLDGPRLVLGLDDLGCGPGDSMDPRT